MSRLFLILLLVSHTARPAVAQSAARKTPAAEPLTGRDIVKKMYDRYAGKWYSTLTFTQTTEAHLTTGTATFIYRGDTSYRFVGGKHKSNRLYNDDQYVLQGSLFFVPLDQVYAFFDEDGFDLKKAHEDICNGRPIYVIGEPPGWPQNAVITTMED